MFFLIFFFSFLGGYALGAWWAKRERRILDDEVIRLSAELKEIREAPHIKYGPRLVEGVKGGPELVIDPSGKITLTVKNETEHALWTTATITRDRPGE